jgi:hypothetical protein
MMLPSSESDPVSHSTSPSFKIKFDRPLWAGPFEVNILEEELRILENKRGWFNGPLMQLGIG